MLALQTGPARFVFNPVAYFYEPRNSGELRKPLPTGVLRLRWYRELPISGNPWHLLHASTQ